MASFPPMIRSIAATAAWVGSDGGGLGLLADFLVGRLALFFFAMR